MKKKYWEVHPMKIVILDGHALNPGDLSWDWLKQFGTYTFYERTAGAPLTIERIGDADIIILNKTPITEEILALAGGTGSSLGSGGMATKLRAAQIVMEAGIDMVITNGEQPDILYDIVEGKAVGTRFKGKG
jgi:hypothetical protein